MKRIRLFMFGLGSAVKSWKIDQLEQNGVPCITLHYSFFIYFIELEFFLMHQPPDF